MEHSKLESTTEMTWEVDGEEYRLVRFTDVPETSEGMVEFLGELLGCNRLEAEYAYRILMEDSEFITSVTDDIQSLPLYEG